MENIEGYIRPKRGPGWYNVTITFTNDHVQTGAPYETVSVVKNILLNDIPKADPSAGSYVLGSRPTERDVTFDATASIDDGPMTDLTVTWFFGAHWEGDTLHFSRTGASGTITLDPERLEIQVELGLLLRPFTNAVEQSVNEYLDEYLA